jgi:hypothetical protein
VLPELKQTGPKLMKKKEKKSVNKLSLLELSFRSNVKAVCWDYQKFTSRNISRCNIGVT